MQELGIEIGCPHRWCRPLHRAGLILWYTLLLAYSVFAAVRGGVSYWLLLAASLGVGVVLAAVLVVHQVRALREQFSAVEAAGWTRLRVRPGWARLAVATDVALSFLYVAGIAVTATGIVWWEGDQSDVSWVPHPIPLAVVVALVVVDHIAHLRGVTVEDAPVADSPGAPAGAGGSE